ncbi:hypothetical protein GE061_002434 [Apolygus lucorum]|uniref:Uncharacterized protein n=1 Tax=Apolygus lucorum TaxID=248454 RepID=A0A8S9X6G6_APOLU|nr:hypothetical protein GE061_002434 [Apolygus lucorum]
MISTFSPPGLLVVNKELEMEDVQVLEFEYSAYLEFLGKKKIKLQGEPSDRSVYPRSKNLLPLPCENNITLYDLVKGEPSTRSVVQVSSKWCDAHSLVNQSFCDNKRNFSVSYESGLLKRQLQKLAKSRKKASSSFFSDIKYTIDKESKKAVHIVSDVDRKSVRHYIKMFEDPNSLIWDDWLKSFSSATGHAIGDIVINIVSR